MEGFGDADDELYQEITRHFTHWDDIDVHFKGEVLRSTGHGFAGLARLKLLQILAARARALVARPERPLRALPRVAGHG